MQLTHFKLIASQIKAKYEKAMGIVKSLNITNAEFVTLEKQWAAHKDMITIPATSAGIQQLIERAEKQSVQNRYSHYIQLNLEYLQLNSMIDER